MEKYIEHITETDKDARNAGDQQILVAGEEEKVEDYEKTGNQKDEYYKK